MSKVPDPGCYRTLLLKCFLLPPLGIQCSIQIQWIRKVGDLSGIALMLSALSTKLIDMRPESPLLADLTLILSSLEHSKETHMQSCSSLILQVNLFDVKECFD